MITIDENKLAQALAFNRIKVHIPLVASQIQFENDDYIFHTENAEKVFNKWFDEYYTIIMELAETQYSPMISDEEWTAMLKKQRDTLKSIAGYDENGILKKYCKPNPLTTEDIIEGGKKFLQTIDNITDDYKKNNLITCIHCGELNIKGTVLCANSKCREVIKI